MSATALQVPRDYDALRDSLRELGYELKRERKHEVWSRDGQNFVIPKTGSDWRSLQNAIRDLRNLHPGVFERRKSDNPLSKDQRRARSLRREGRSAARMIALHEGANGRKDKEPPVAVGVPNPGSPEAVAMGCGCPVFQNRHGVGVEGQDGVFAHVKHCSVHGWEDAPVKRLEPAEPKVDVVPDVVPHYQGVRKRGAGWEAYWSDANRRQRAKMGFATPEEARDYRDAQLVGRSPRRSSGGVSRRELLKLRERLAADLSLLDSLLEIEEAA